MSEERLEQLLIEALDLLEQNVAIDEILARYPGEAEALRPFLATAVQLSELLSEPEMLPSPQAQVQSKQAFLAAADSLEAAAAPSAARLVSPWAWLQRFLAPVLAILLIAFLAGATIVTAAGSALPGDTLYGTKRFVEQVRLSQAANPEALQEQYRQERIREAERLLSAGRTAQVTISGDIQAIEADRIVVGGLVINLTTETVVEGEPFVGRTVVVEGHTEDGVLIADRIVVDEQSGPPIPTPTPTVTITSSPTATPSPTSTPESTATSEPTITPLPSATLPPSPTNTLEPTDLPPTIAPPTAVPPTQPPPPPDDNGNDNDDDNENDNGNANDNDDDNNNGGGNDNNDDGGGSGGDNENDDDDNSGSGGNDNDDGGDDNSNDNNDDGGNGGNDNDDDNRDDGGNDNDDDDRGGDDNDNGD